MDRENVIKGLECCAGQCNYHGCPYKDPCENANGVKQIMLDAIALLKSQQAEIEPSEAEMMVEHADGTVEYVKDIDNIMLLAHKDYHITYTGAF